VCVYGCVNVRVGCGSGTSPIDVAPHQSTRVRTVRRAIQYRDWQWQYLVRTRWTPPPDAVVVETTVPTGAGNLLSGEIALDWDSFRPTTRSRVLQPYEAINVSRRLTIFLEEVQRPGGLSVLQISGELYQGDTTGGRISARRLDWRPVTNGDSATAAQLRREAERVTTAITMSYNEFRDSVLRRGAAGTLATGGMRLAPVAMGSTDIRATQLAPRELGGGRSRVCRAQGRGPEAPLVVALTEDPACAIPDTIMHMQYNAYVVVAPNRPRIGTRLETCSAYTRDVPSGWESVEWHSDTTLCPVDGVGIDSAQPNVLVIQRVR
jgi:hypothetical protein